MNSSIRNLARTWLAGLLAITLLIAVPSLALADDGSEKAAKDEKAVAVAAEATAAEPAAAEPAPAPTPQMTAPPYAAPDRSSFAGFRVYGDILFNWQSVSVDGNESRFRKDFGYFDGVYVGTSKLTFVPDGDDAAEWFDQIQVRADGLGFDSDKPNRYRQWGVSARKAGKYRFDVNSRRHNYFWQYEGFLGDFDQYRSFTDVDLSVNASENLEIMARYRHWSTSGTQLSAYDYARDEYEFPTDLDQRGDTFGAGLRWRIGQTTLWLNQDFRQFKGNYQISDRDNPGLNPVGSYMALIEQKEVRSMNAPITSAGVMTQFLENKFRLEVDFMYADQTLGTSYSRYWAGLGSSGTPDTENTSSQGESRRQLRNGNARLFFRPDAAWGFTLQYRRRGWEQTGSRFLVTDSTPAYNGLDYDLQLDQVVLGGEFAPARAFSVFAEVGTGKRSQDISHNYVDENGDFGGHADHPIEDTDFTSYRFGARMRAGRDFDAEASYERNDVDNAFTRLSATGINSFKAKARYRMGTSWTISGAYTNATNKNNELRNTTGGSETGEVKLNNLGVNVQYMAGQGRFLYAGYQYLNNKIDMPIIFWNPTPRVQIDGDAIYDGKNNVFTVGGEYLLSQDVPVSVYGNLNYVDSDLKEVATPGTIWTAYSFPIVYHDIRVGARYVFPMGLILDAQGRFMKYEDKSDTVFALNTYDANMFTLGVGYRF